ncbi:EAL domain-containing protein [Lachnospiraceae bacterium LCP25S3_G4]
MSDTGYIHPEKSIISQNELYIDNQRIIGNMIQYQEDKYMYNFNKLCMIKIENADLLLAYLGEKSYLNLLKKALLEIHQYMKKEQFNGILSVYFIDNSTFIIVGKPHMEEEKFVKIITKIFTNFQYINPHQTNTPILTRFVVVINQPNMLERALEELFDEKNSQMHLIISDSNANKVSGTEQELKMINIIYWAIQNDAVIPYYQGIYDNRKKCIEKYEALMRIKDSDGTIYSPNSFINIAKKYHIYTKLSEIMIGRVLLEIDDKNMEVSVNLSAYDINSSDFRKFLYELLAQRKSKKLLVFEILEDEVFKDAIILKQFVSDVETYGVKIAIDDFGSGYSNLLEIAQISPHYIKIDGGIIRALNKSSKNRIILDAIVYLSQKLGARVVAEHVESMEIQKSIEQLNIDFSQGYYFSKPLPMESLFSN